jgi:cell wall-associated NlpC family hydrolase
VTGQTATGGPVRGRRRARFGVSASGWAPIVVSLAAAAALLVLAVGPASADPTIRSKQAQAQAVLAEIRALDSEVARAAESWNYAQLELERLNGELASNGRHLVAARRSLVVAQQRIAERLRELYVAGDGDSTLEVILGSRSLDDVIARFDAIQRVSNQDAQILRTVERYRREVETRRARLQQARAEQERIVAQRAAEKEAIEAKLAERQRLVASIKDEIARLQAAERRRQAALAAQARARLQAQRLAALEAAEQPAAPVEQAAAAAPPAPLPDGSRAAQVVAIAMQYLGVPYQWGGASPAQGFDCSGFVMYVYAQIGISLPHNAAMQFGYGTPVSREELQPGDLVFFDGLGHNGIYIGGGQFIHAPHTGDVVKISSLYEDWYASQWVGARRIL